MLFSYTLAGFVFFGYSFAVFFCWLTEYFLILFADMKASLTHSLHAQAVPVREKAPEREPLPVSKGSAFGR